MNNLGYVYASEFNNRGWPVKLLIDQSAKFQLDRPESMNAELANNYPDWIEELSVLGARNYYQLRFPLFFFRKLIKKLNSYDVVVLNGIWLPLAPYIKKNIRVVLLFAGFDLDVAANDKKAGFLADMFLAGKKKLRLFRPLVKAAYAYTIRQQQGGLRRGDAINYFPTGINPEGDGIIDDVKAGQSFERLELRGFPVNDYPYIDNYTEKKVFTILNFTRFFFTDNLRNDNKRNDIMISGIAQFIRSNNITESDIVIEFYEKGNDVDVAKKLIESYGIESYITWMQPVSQTILDEKIKSCHVAFDQLGNQWIGYGIAVMLLGKPVIANSRPEIFETITGEKSPVCQATTAEDVAKWLKLLFYNRELGRLTGKACSDYYRRHHNIDNTLDFIAGR